MALASGSLARCFLIVCLVFATRAEEASTDLQCQQDGQLSTGTQANGLLNILSGNIINKAASVAKPWGAAIERGDSGGTGATSTGKHKIKEEKKAAKHTASEEGEDAEHIEITGSGAGSGEQIQPPTEDSEDGYAEESNDSAGSGGGSGEKNQPSTEDTEDEYAGESNNSTGSGGGSGETTQPAPRRRGGGTAAARRRRSGAEDAEDGHAEESNETTGSGGGGGEASPPVNGQDPFDRAAPDESTPENQYAKTHKSALAYLQALGDVGTFKDFGYLYLFTDKTMVSDPVGSEMKTKESHLSTSISSMRATIAPLGFDIIPRAATVAQDPKFAAAYSTVKITGSNVSFDRADLIEFTEWGKVKGISAYYNFAASALGVKSPQHSVTNKTIYGYLHALHELGTNKSLDYFNQFADEFEVHDPFGTAPVLTIKDLQSKIKGLATMVAPQGFMVKIKAVTVAADERFGSAYFDLMLLASGKVIQEIPIIDIFEISSAGKIMNLKAVWNLSPPR